MYTLVQNSLYRFTIYRHENCEFDIHYIAKKVLSELNSKFGNNGGEYTVRDDNKVTIALYH